MRSTYNNSGKWSKPYTPVKHSLIFNVWLELEVGFVDGPDVPISGNLGSFYSSASAGMELKSSRPVRPIGSSGPKLLLSPPLRSSCGSLEISRMALNHIVC